MKQLIKIKDLFNTELYTRSKATELRDCIRNDAENVELDFSDVSFMSRSFADELYNVVDSFRDKSFSYVNCNEIVNTMLAKVAEGRRRERKRGIANPKFVEIKDMSSLERFLYTL